MRDETAAIEQMGQKPINPIGQCFETTGAHVFELPGGFKIWHGIGVSNFPGENGCKIAHAWIEDAEGFAYDTTWGIKTEAAHYRSGMKLEYCVGYTREEFLNKWALFDYPGPWDAKIKRVCDGGKR